VHPLCHSFVLTFWRQAIKIQFLLSLPLNDVIHIRKKKPNILNEMIRCGLRESINDRVDFCVLVISSNRQTLSICQTIPMSTFIRATQWQWQRARVSFMSTQCPRRLPCCHDIIHWRNVLLNIRLKMWKGICVSVLQRTVKFTAMPHKIERNKRSRKLQTKIMNDSFHHRFSIGRFLILAVLEVAAFSSSVRTLS
jgi:hypothetical protein